VPAPPSRTDPTPARGPGSYGRCSPASKPALRHPSVGPVKVRTDFNQQIELPPPSRERRSSKATRRAPAGTCAGYSGPMFRLRLFATSNRPSISCSKQHVTRKIEARPQHRSRNKRGNPRKKQQNTKKKKKQKNEEKKNKTKQKKTKTKNNKKQKLKNAEAPTIKQSQTNLKQKKKNRNKKVPERRCSPSRLHDAGSAPSPTALRNRR